MPYSLAIFDLDGTLVDCFPWFRRTINDVADRFGFRRVAEDELETIRATVQMERFRIGPTAMIAATALRVLVLIATLSAGLTPVTCPAENVKPLPAKATKE